VTESEALFTISHDDWTLIFQPSKQGTKVLKRTGNETEIVSETSLEEALQDALEDWLWLSVDVGPFTLEIPEGSEMTQAALFDLMASVFEDEDNSGGLDTLLNPNLAPFQFKGVSYNPALLDDESCILVENRGEHQVLAMFSFAESDAMISGRYRSCVGRLPTGEIFRLTELGEPPTTLRVLSEPMSNLQAVQRWLDDEDQDYRLARRTFTAVYKDGRDVKTAADVDPDDSETAELEYALNLTADEIATLLNN